MVSVGVHVAVFRRSGCVTKLMGLATSDSQVATSTAESIKTTIGMGMLILNMFRVTTTIVFLCHSYGVYTWANQDKVKSNYSCSNLLLIHQFFFSTKVFGAKADRLE